MKFRVLVFLLFFLATLCFSQESDEWYQGKPIKDITFTGLKSISASELEALVNPYKGRAFSDVIFWELLGKLYALEYFDNIEPSTERADDSGREVILVFNVRERPVIGRINFVGNSNIRNRELQELITSKAKDIYNLSKVRLDIEAIKNKYIEKGYPNVEVTSSETRSGDSTITLVFHVTENSKLSISRIDFQGNTRFNSGTLRGQLSLKAKSLINDGAFQEAKLLVDREAVARYYHDRGFIDANVRDVTRTLTVTDKGTTMVLTFLIDEGTEYRFGGMSFEGNIIFTTEQLSNLVMSKEGEIVNMTRLEMDLQRIADLYYENGYIFNLITSTPERNTQTNVLSYAISIVERSRAYIENIIIVGNHKTNANVILREIPLEPGDVFSKAKVFSALRNLYNLQYFSTILPETLPGSSENLMDLVFTLEEQPTTDVQFGLTFSGSADPEAFPISGLIKWNDRNLVGSGNELGVELNSSVVDTSTVAVNYLHRWAFGLPLSLGIDVSANYSKRLTTMNNGGPFNPVFYGNEDRAYPDGFISYEDYINRGKLPTREFMMNYDEWYLSLGLSTGYRWITSMGNLNLNGGVRFGLVNNSYDSEIYRPFDPVIRDGNNSWMPKNSVWMSISLDKRDIFYDPTSGFYLYDRIGLYGILNDEREHYINNSVKAQFYHTLFKFDVTEKWSFRCVLAIHAGLSVVFGQPGRPLDIVNGNKLSVDGMFIGRGWSEAYSNKGLLLFDSWIELRIPIVMNVLAWDFFLDIAGVETEEGYYFGKNQFGRQNFTYENLKFSFGGGIRFTIPQFPIRFSLAKRFTIQDGQIQWKSGMLFGDPNNPIAGVDPVLSFILSY